MRVMEFADFYEIAQYGNVNWKGSFTPKEIAQNAHDYMCEYETSKERKKLTHTMRELVKLLKEDGTSKCLNWARHIKEVEPDEEITIDGIIFRHGENDYGLWNGFALSEEDETAIWQILQKYDTEGCSVRGTRRQIAREMM